MRILLLIKNFDFGGAENHVCDLANALAESGHKVIVVSRPGRQLQKLNASVVHHQKSLSDFRLWRHVPWLINLIKKEGINVIHGHQRIAILAATLVSKLTGTPSIATIHGKIRHDLRSDFVKREINKVIAVCGNSFKGTQNNEYLAAKAILVHNGIAQKKAKKKEVKKGFSFLYGSRFDQRHSSVIKMLVNEVWPLVLEKQPNAKLILCGDGSATDELSKEVKNFNNKVDRNTIRLVGYKNNLPEEISKSSLVMGVGRVATEALSSGIPVLSLNALHGGTFVSTQNYQQMKYGNFVDIDSPAPTAAQIVEKLNSFFVNRTEIENETQLVQGHVENDFCQERNFAKTIAVYKSLVEEAMLKKRGRIFSLVRSQN